MGGRAPYDGCVRLVAYAAFYWEAFDGELASRGVDPLSLPFDRFLNAVYAFMISELRNLGGMQPVSLDEAKNKLDADLAKPIPGRRQRRVSEAVVQDEMALFAAAAGSSGR